MISEQTKIITVLSAAIITVSSAAILVRFIEGVDATVIAFWRMVGSALLLGGFLKGVKHSDLVKGSLSGLFLAIHFACWFTSLQQIPVMRSTLLVTLAPIWAGLIEWLILRRPPNTRFWVGILIALPGLVIMAHGSLGQASLIGDLLAIFGGITGAIYFTIGRELRQRISFVSYSGLVCLIAALALFPMAVISKGPFISLGAANWLFIGLLIAGPQLIGHNGLNYVLKYLPASTVSATTLLEPLGAAILAWLLLNEIPAKQDILGGTLVLFGVFQAIISSRNKAAPGSKNRSNSSY